MKRRGFQRGNEQSAAAHAARWGERVVSDAGASALAIRAPYPPPSGALIAPHHTGAAEPATAAAPAAPDGTHRNLELCKTLKTTTEQFSLFSTEQFGGRRIKSGTRGKPPRRVRVTATRAWAQLAGVRASKMLPYIISLMPLVRSQPVSRAAASLGPKGPAVLRRRCRQYRRAPRNSWQHVS